MMQLAETLDNAVFNSISNEHEGNETFN